MNVLLKGLMMFKRDKIFKQFVSSLEGFEKLDLPRDFPPTAGIVKVYQTDWDEVELLKKAMDFDMSLVKENERASKFMKYDSGFEVILIYNKNDKSILISMSKIRKVKRR